MAAFPRSLFAAPHLELHGRVPGRKGHIQAVGGDVGHNRREQQVRVEGGAGADRERAVLVQDLVRRRRRRMWSGGMRKGRG